MNRLCGTRAVGALVLTGALISCDTASRTVEPEARNGMAAHIRGALACAVTFEAGHVPAAMTCQQSGGTRMTAAVSSSALAPRFVVVSSQGVLVNLIFANVAFDSLTNIFSFTTRVQNLMTQPIGTTDGVTTAPLGVAVFYTTPPHPTNGSGTVTPTNAICCATFTAANQAYYSYTPFIKPDSTSAPQTWTFLLASTVQSFGFAVEVSAPVPAEQSVLRWRTLRQGISQAAFHDVWRAATTDIWAVGDGGVVVHYDGAAWAVAKTISPAHDLLAVSGTSGADIWTVGRGGLASHFNGTTWTNAPTPGFPYLDGVWASAPNDVWAVGGPGVVLHNTGAGWVAVANPTTQTLRHVWGADASHIWAVGDNGTILFYNGTSWAAQTSGTTHALYGVWGASPTDVYACGQAGDIRHFNGVHWTPVASGTTTFLLSIGGSGPTDVWTVGVSGVQLHFDGAAWSAPASRPVGTILRGVTAGSATSVAAVGDAGTLLNLRGAAFALSDQAGLPLYGVWADSAADSVWASSIGTTLLYDGTRWTGFFAGSADTMRAISGVNAHDVYTAGAAGDIPQWTGAAWTNRFVKSGFLGLDAVQFNTIYAVGTAGLVARQNGATWTQLASPTTADIDAAWGPATSNVFMVAANGGIFRFTNGVTFVPMVSGTTNALFGVHGRSATDVYAVGQGGRIVHLSGAGLTWTTQASGTANTLRAVWEAAAGDVYAVGDGGTMVHGNGASWITLGSPVTTALRGAFGTARTNVYVVGDNGVVLLGTQ
jgi:hypothetical protein